ncbi:MAG: hypothetical protein LAN37_15605 [Acidobacteriia bacterium]|nr:hypothetical protein [Terriglobia bacterium]
MPASKVPPGRRQAMAAARREHAAERLQRLRVYRGIFSLLAAALLALAAISGAAEVPYEPYLALFISAFGIVIVFSLKLWEAK